MTTTQTQPYAAFVLRLILGIMFLAHSLTKLLVFPPSGTAGFFQQIGFPGFLAYTVIAFEIIGGLFLVFGVYAGWVAGLAAVQLLIAATVHFGNGWSFSNVNGGWEYPVFLAFTALALALFDDGAWALKRSV